jgi:hypothetical protein
VTLVSVPKQLAAYDGSIDALCRQRGRKLHIEAEYCWCSECRKLLEESSMEHQLCSSPRMEPLRMVSFRFLKGPDDDPAYIQQSVRTLPMLYINMLLPPHCLHDESTKPSLIIQGIISPRGIIQPTSGCKTQIGKYQSYSLYLSPVNLRHPARVLPPTLLQLFSL